MSDKKQLVSTWGHTLIDLVERAYNVVRGLPHNRNASVVVVVGCAIMVGPIWEPFVRASFERLTGVRVDLPTEPTYGVILIVLGLGYHAGMTWLGWRESEAKATRDRQTDDRIRVHDAPIFEKFIETAPENKFTWALGNLCNDHAYSSDESMMIISTYYFLDTVSNEFNDPELQKKANALKSALDKLTGFNGQHFFALDQPVGGQLRFALAPHWNWDRGGNPTAEQSRSYGQLGKQLSDLVNSVTEAYTDILRTGQQRLF